MEDRVHVVEEVFRAKSLLEVARAIGDEGQAQPRFNLRNELGREVGLAPAGAGAEGFSE